MNITIRKVAGVAAVSVGLAFGAGAGIASAGDMNVSVSSGGVIDDDGFVNPDQSEAITPTYPVGVTFPEASSWPADCILEAVQCDRPQE